MLIVMSITNLLTVFLYADDIILISPPVIGLQQILDACSATATSLALKFNGKKSHCLSLGKLNNFDICPMLIDNQLIAWCQSIKYLGVHLFNGKGMSFDNAPVKRAFYAACNNIFSHSCDADEIIPVVPSRSRLLTNSAVCFNCSLFKLKQLSKLNVCWNSVYRKILNFRRRELDILFIIG